MKQGDPEGATPPTLDALEVRANASAGRTLGPDTARPRRSRSRPSGVVPWPPRTAESPASGSGHLGAGMLPAPRAPAGVEQRPYGLRRAGRLRLATARRDRTYERDRSRSRPTRAP